MGGVELVVYLCQKLVGVKGAGNVALPFAARNIGRGDEVVDDSQRYRIDTVGADYAADAITNEDLAGGGIDGLGRRGAEVANAFQGCRNDGPVQEGTGGLAQ